MVAVGTGFIVTVVLVLVRLVIQVVLPVFCTDNKLYTNVPDAAIDTGSTAVLDEGAIID